MAKRKGEVPSTAGARHAAIRAAFDEIRGARGVEPGALPVATEKEGLDALQAQLGYAATADDAAAAMAAAGADLGGSGKVLVVRSRRQKGRRRAGREFGPEDTVIPFDALTPDERDAIAGDPELHVSIRPAVEAPPIDE
jgi:hypothetical protein